MITTRNVHCKSLPLFPSAAHTTLNRPVTLHVPLDETSLYVFMRLEPQDRKPNYPIRKRRHFAAPLWGGSRLGSQPPGPSGASPTSSSPHAGDRVLRLF